MRCLGGVTQCGLDGGRVMFDKWREGRCVAAWCRRWHETTKLLWIFIPKVARWFDGGDDFRSVCIGCILRVC
jgi:hypothetical protein